MSHTEVVNLGMPKTDDKTGEEHVSYHAIECRTCGWLTELYKGRDGEVVVYNLQSEHYDHTDHVRYWHYKIERSYGRIVNPGKGHW
jgi:hypothetical protein